MFLSDKDIKELMRRKDDPLGIKPYNEARLTPNGYDMAVEVLDKDGNPIPGTTYEIKPNELIKVRTVETIETPNGHMGLMLLRSRYTRQGLMGLFAVIDSGFKGVIKASIKNLSGDTIPIKLDDGVIHLILARMSSDSETPYGTDSSKHHWQNQK